MTRIPEKMAAIHIDGTGEGSCLELRESKTPRLKKGEVLMKVAAAGVNRADILQRKGNYPPPKGASPIMGLELSGAVIAVGEGVEESVIGKEMCALVPGGGYAEYCTVHLSNTLPIPSTLSLVEGASLPEAFFTVWTNVFERGNLKNGESILIHGGASGIGTTAVMLAHQFGHTVFTTAGSDRKCEAVRKLGGDHVINYQTDDFLEVVARETGGRGVDVILDFIGGNYLPRNIACLARDGRLVNIAYMKGSTVKVDFLPVMLKRLTLTGSTLRARPVKEKARIADALKEMVWPLLEKGEIFPVIDSVYKLSEAADAHRRMEQSKHIGKILLEV